ncbi:hypothetical protein CERZMDRAFT_88405 [Cercospora zeae-maydis SCOH1-5]|uniref:Uncharacterized protein n=1 Tax=Cercospora zeae-maydis SCOH1-5 TaxID=717836 RepID=A0A6A6F5G6_9PEZI|nr:hypothetical protein CERZMDRAFT_88405 [Cercospora zeae-maydis SCOH1-5]
MWLKTNNTCPSCRTKLFDEVDVGDEEDHIEIAPVTGAASVHPAEQEQSSSQRSTTEATSESVDSELQNPIEVQNDEEVIGKELEVLPSGISRRPSPISFDPPSIRRSLLRLQSDGYPLPEWFADMDQWDVLYTFEVNGNVSAWMFQCTEFNDLPGFASIDVHEWEEVAASHKRPERCTSSRQSKVVFHFQCDYMSLMADIEPWMGRREHQAANARHEHSGWGLGQMLEEAWTELGKFCSGNAVSNASTEGSSLLANTSCTRFWLTIHEYG